MTTIDDIHPDILAQAFRRMDGPTLASAACSSSLFHFLSADPTIWREVCLSSWPSLRLLPVFSSLSPVSLFADSFPFPDTHQTPSNHHNLSKILFSCVDISHAGNPIFSRVVTTDTSSPWFADSVFQIDAMDRKEPPELEKWAPISPESLELSWVVVDPGTGRTVNLSSRRAVEIGQHWYTGETLVKFVMVIDDHVISIVVTCGEKAGQVRAVSMTVEDRDGVAVGGRGGLVIVAAAMEGRRRGRGEGDVVKMRYEEYLRSKRVRKEKKAKREGMMDLCCTTFGGIVFLTFLLFLAFRT